MVICTNTDCTGFREFEHEVPLKTGDGEVLGTVLVTAFQCTHSKPHMRNRYCRVCGQCEEMEATE